jgi:predicted nucleic acid-binding protein
MKYALDTNIVSYYMKGNKQIVEKLDSEAESDNILIPFFVYFEIKKWLLALDSKTKLSAFDKMFEAFGAGMIDRETFDLALSIYIKLRKAGITVDDGDLLIAAYCILNNHILVTNNERHFEKIEGLQVVNWAD